MFIMSTRVYWKRQAFSKVKAKFIINHGISCVWRKNLYISMYNYSYILTGKNNN